MTLKLGLKMVKRIPMTILSDAETFSTMTLSIMTLSITTLSVMTFSIMTLGI